MNTENKLRALALLFNSYSILATMSIVYSQILQSKVMSPLEISILVTVAIALFLGILSDTISR